MEGDIALHLRVLVKDMKLIRVVPTRHRIHYVTKREAEACSKICVILGTGGRVLVISG